MSANPSQSSNVLSPSYFSGISNVLKRASVYHPTLVIDKARLDHNIQAVKAVVNRGFDFRIVAKSLPSVAMLKYLMAEIGTRRLMSFHMPFLQHVAEHIPDADVLMGKPMPVASVETFYSFIDSHSVDEGSEQFNPDKQLQWLVDSNERLQQYAELATKLNKVLRISLEIDVGLHRGGFDNAEAFKQALGFIKNHDQLELSGLMGYEAHITKIPSLLGGYEKAFKESCEAYREFSDLVADEFGEAFRDRLTLNAGGSTTYPLYEKPGLVNEISTASALVKPTDFDVFTLEHHAPAAFIATPVLKVVNNPELPMAKGLSKLLHRVGMLPRKACFIYGGNWLAQPCYPAHAKRSRILGHSSNQEMYDLKTDDSISMDDFMYFRPTQSEAVFLQFGDMAVYESGNIVDWWSVFDYRKKQS